jgi:peptidoglycan/LPS O-acetylase OafA/YrhL
MYPYFLWGSIETLVLLLASGLTNQPLSLPLDRALLQILWAPPAQFWFLYALFFLHVIALVTLSLGGRLLFAGAFALLYTVCVVSPQVSDLLAHYIAGTNILFYVLGVSLGGPLVAWRGTVVRPYLLMLIAGTVCSAAVWAAWSAKAASYSYVALPAAFAGTAAILLLAYADPFRLSRWLEPLGRRSMPIYLLHILFLAGARILLVKAFHVSNVDLILPIIFVIGVAGPLVCERIARSLRLNLIVGLG